jgi:AmmeMemoRadiSam system protein B/AmmeMemoRadiSam system protein A
MQGLKLHNFFQTIFTGVIIMALFNFRAQSDVVVRKPAVAGRFYTANPDELRKEIKTYLGNGKKLPGYPQLLICPHAGHSYSGQIAALGYAAINPDVKTVFLLGPSHHTPFSGIVVSNADYFETPLGKIPVDKKIIEKLIIGKMVTVNGSAHENEHCLEVQLPFLQVALGEFSIVPLLMIDVDANKAAEMLNPFIDSTTVIIASSDFAHVYNYDECKNLDKQSIATIMQGNVNGPIEACGEMPVRVIMRLAEMRGLKPLLIDARNSRDITGGSGDGYVVGYASIVYIEKNNEENRLVTDELKTQVESSEESTGISDSDKTFLLKIAREALNHSVKNQPTPSLSDCPESVKNLRGCFVTLTKYSELRGCIGYLEGIKPLYMAVIENAKNAALNDSRFPVVTQSELKDIKVEISVLTNPEPLEYKNPEDLLAKLEPGRDGLILSSGNRQSTFLPQVWEQLPDKVEFLEHLSLKAGLPKDAWKKAGFKRYFAIHFEERN